MSVLTIDLGTSATKAALWEGDQLLGVARAPIATAHPRPGWAEQAPDDWWLSVVAACHAVVAEQPAAVAGLQAVGFSAARETFVLVDERLAPLGPGILWSDRRAEAQSLALADAPSFRARTGVSLGAGTHAAKLAWVAENQPTVFERARWVLSPRDLVVARLAAIVGTDETLASRTGLCALDGGWLPEAIARYADRLPPITSAASVVGRVSESSGHELGIAPGVPVVIGAGDRACEVLGVDATPSTPMVSWGTTASVSVPHPGPMHVLPTVGQVSRGAVGGFVVEAGLGAAGAALGWLASLTGRSHDELLDLAAATPPGADGVIALPWFAGARAPWWRLDAHAAFTGLTDGAGPGEMARALIEGVAFDVARSVELIAPEAEQLALAGGGAASSAWRGIAAAVTRRPVVRRRIDDAALVGARLLVAEAVGEALDVDVLNPVVRTEDPQAAWVVAYESVRESADAAASAVLDL
jgi:xylulokinase